MPLEGPGPEDVAVAWSCLARLKELLLVAKGEGRFEEGEVSIFPVLLVVVVRDDRATIILRLWR